MSDELTGHGPYTPVTLGAGTARPALVERLLRRKREVSTGTYNFETALIDDEDCQEAAAEIMRLLGKLDEKTAAIATLKMRLGSCSESNEKLFMSNYQLRRQLSGLDPDDGSEPTLPLLSRVQKIRGYQWPGLVVAAFDTLAGHRRYVVECTVPEVAGALHIYSPDQIEKVEEAP